MTFRKKIIRMTCGSQRLVGLKVVILVNCLLASELTRLRHNGMLIREPRYHLAFPFASAFQKFVLKPV